MPFVSDEELFSAPAASKPAGNFVSDDELFAARGSDNWPAEPPRDQAKPQLGARPTPQQMESYVSWRDTHDDFGRPTAPKSGPRREYASTSPGGQFFEDVAQNTLDASVTVADMVLGAPGQLAAVGRNASARLQAYFKDPSLDRRTIAGIGAVAQQEVPAAFTAPIKTLTDRLRRGDASLGAPPEDYISTGMEAVGEGIKGGARKLQSATKGAIIEEDTQFLADSGMALLGMKGLTTPFGKGSGLKLPNPKNVNEHFGSPDRGTETIDPREGPEPTPAQADNYFKTYNEVKATETDLGRSDARTNAEQQAYDLMQKGASKAQVEAIVKRNPLVGEAMAAIRSRRAMASESGLGRVLQGEVLDPETGLTPDFGSPDTPRIGPGREVVPTAGEPLATAANKNPLWLGAAGLAGTGLALSLAYPEQRDEALATAGMAGALIIGKNRGLSLADIRALPDSAPLGHVLNNSAYTLKTLERLPRNKTTFSVQEVLDQAKRADVSDTEKTLFRDAIDMAGGDGKTISAKELVANIKELAEHQELTKKDFHGENYSEYGIGALDRQPKSVNGDAWQAMEDADTAGDWKPEGGWKEPPVVEDVTTLWKNPKIEFGGSHFADSDVFGHTRSFIQDGVRHVIEVQSDFVQKGMKKVGPRLLEEAQTLRRERPEANLPEVDKILGQHQQNIRYRSMAKDFAKRLVREELAREATPKLNPDWVSRVQAVERAQRILAESRNVARDSGVDPAKYTRRNQVDLEYAQQRLAEVPKNLPAADVARFATADTVAKVEGWPRSAEMSFEDMYPDADVLPASDRIAYESRQFSDPGHQSLYDRHKKEVEGFTLKLGGKLVTDASGHTWVEVPTKPFSGPTQMYGRVDEGLQRMLGAGAVGALAGAYLANPDSKYIGAGLGLLVGALLAKPGNLTKLSDAAEYGLGAPSTTLLNASPPLLRRVYRKEQIQRKRVHEAIVATEPLSAALKSLSKERRAALEIAIIDNNPEKIAAAVKASGHPAIGSAIQQALGVQKVLGQEMLNLGIVTSLRENYFVRSVKDYEGLVKHLGGELGGKLDEAIKSADKRAFVKRGFGLSKAERDIFVNRFLQGREAMGGKKGFAKERKLDEVTTETRPFYEDPIVGLHTYVESAIKSIETAKLFGKDLRVEKAEGRSSVNLPDSIGALINREREAGRLSSADADKIEGTMRSVLLNGEKTARGFVQDARSVINSSLLGNPVSAVGQLAEIGPIAYMHEIVPTGRALARRLTNRGTVNLKDTGIAEHAAMEFSGERLPAKVVKKQFELSGFTASDTGMKNLALEARKIKYEQLNNPKKAAAFEVKYKEFFGGDYPQVLDDLKKGRQTPLTDEVAWFELAQNQPTSNWEIPRSLLDNPNGRIMAALKTFMLKQADVVRRTIWKDYREGRPLKATKDLARLTLLFGVAGVPVAAVQAIMMNRAPEGFTLDNILSNAVKTFMWSNYMADQAEKKGTGKFIWENVVAPPVGVFDDLIFNRFKNPPTEREQEKLDRDFMKKVPGVGKLYEAWAMGGGELADAKKEKAEKKEASRAELKARAESAGHALSDDELKAIRQEVRDRKQLQGARP